VSRRAEQLGATLGRAIQETISRGFQDPRIRGLITVTGVRISDDLRTAVVSVSIYPESAQNPTIHGLSSAARHIRHEVAGQLAMRQVPELVFKLDESLKKQAAVLGAIAKAEEHRPFRAAVGGPPDAPAEGGAAGAAEGGQP
jgi:ribosome-binding factor A